MPPREESRQKAPSGAFLFLAPGKLLHRHHKQGSAAEARFSGYAYRRQIRRKSAQSEQLTEQNLFIPCLAKILKREPI